MRWAKWSTSRLCVSQANTVTNLAHGLELEDWVPPVTAFNDFNCKSGAFATYGGNGNKPFLNMSYGDICLVVTHAHWEGT
jgi:hypothetical protein